MPNGKSVTKPEAPMVIPFDSRLHPSTIEKLRESGFKIKRTGSTQKQNKVPTTIRLDPDVLAALRAMGKGWQPKTNDLLRKLLKL